MPWYKEDITILISHPNFVEELKKEIAYKNVSLLFQLDRFFAIAKSDHTFYWASNQWNNPVLIPIESVNDGVRKLKEINRNWDFYSIDYHQRVRTIQKNLPNFSRKPIAFLGELPLAAMGGWTLVEQNLMLCSKECTSLFGNGDYSFLEDKITPPSRAYLKLWEFFTFTKIVPQENSLCFDVGSSPGGWSWVLSQLNCQVHSFDKAELDPKIASIPLIKHFKQSAFAIEPADYQKVDFIFSDIICYPEKLLLLITKWLESGKCQNFVTTIKFQGETDYKIMDEFLKIEGSKIIHLYHNKHEVTWYYIGDPSKLKSFAIEDK